MNVPPGSETISTPDFVVTDLGCATEAVEDEASLQPIRATVAIKHMTPTHRWWALPTLRAKL